jgi:3D (Asp-Asp-Asp) domain-containing protein
MIKLMSVVSALVIAASTIVTVSAPVNEFGDGCARVLETSGVGRFDIIEKEDMVESLPIVVEPLGEFEITAYCACEKCCGVWAQNRPIDEFGNQIVRGCAGDILKGDYSVAVDFDVIPYGSNIVIDGKIYKAQDCGGAIKGNKIDIYLSCHQCALDFGIQYKTVYMIRSNYEGID